MNNEIFHIGVYVRIQDKEWSQEYELESREELTKYLSLNNHKTKLSSLTIPDSLRHRLQYDKYLEFDELYDEIDQVFTRLIRENYL